MVFSQIVLLTIATLLGQSGPTLVERMGYPKDSRLVIVHADDLGQTHSANVASIKAMEGGLVTNGAILAPCPWVAEIAAWARKHPEADLGLQLTFTSEWPTVRWGPLLGRARVPSLVDAEGYFPRSGRHVVEHAKLADVEAEMRAQLAHLRGLGVEPTYIDVHMGSLFGKPELFAAYLRLAREARIPALVTRQMVAPGSPLAKLVGPDDIVIDGKIGIGADVKPQDWAKFYQDKLRGLAPGVYFLEAHIAHDDAEMRAAAAGQDGWGAAFRQREFDVFTSDAFRKLVADTKIRLIGWREVGKLVRKR